jgi:dienelactone hydrolase
MGASHGGALTIQASTKWAKDTFAPNKNGFRAFFALYPFCNVHVPEWKSIYAPIRIHAGELDDWTPAKPCEQYVASLKTSGQDADIHVYPRAHHSFDDPSQQFFYGPQMQSPAKCSFHGSSILDPLTMEPPSCFSRGATNGRNFPAIGSVRENVRSELSKLLR